MMEPQWLSAREDRLWRSYNRMQRALAVAVERQFTESGLSSADFSLLIPLSEAKNHTLRVKELGYYTGWDRSRIAHQLRRMEQRGLLSRHECVTDGRGTMVRLSDEGYAAVVAVVPGHVEVIRTLLLEQLDDEDVDRLTAAAERVVIAVERAFEDAAE